MVWRRVCGGASLQPPAGTTVRAVVSLRSSWFGGAVPVQDVPALDVLFVSVSAMPVQVMQVTQAVEQHSLFFVRSRKRLRATHPLPRKLGRHGGPGHSEWAPSSDSENTRPLDTSMQLGLGASAGRGPALGVPHTLKLGASEPVGLHVGHWALPCDLVVLGANTLTGRRAEAYSLSGVEHSPETRTPQHFDVATPRCRGICTIVR